ncbi:MAG: GIY-YIG nuclease family protein [Nitrosopumilaceae archaeon]
MNLLEDKLHLWLESSRFVKAKPGVYVLYDKNNEVIYIGQSDNLQERFAKYVDTNFEDDLCKQKTVAYQREFLDNPKQRQNQLLEDFKNRFGRLPHCNENLR